MPDDFVPLEVVLRPPAVAETACKSTMEIAAPSSSTPGEGVFDVDDGIADALAAARRFHAALADATEFALERLLRAIACEVLGRELLLAPAEIGAIAAAALQRYAADAPVRLRVFPDQTHALAALNIAVVPDPGLRRGDFALDLRSGTIDATLDARLERVLGATGV